MLSRNASDDPQAFLFRSLAGKSGGGKSGLSMAFKRIMEQAEVDAVIARLSYQRARYTPTLAGKPWKAPAVPLPSHQIEARVAKDTNQHIFSAQMSLAEIIEELPKLTPEERRTIYQQIERLDGEPNFEPTSEMLGAIEEGTRSAQTERMYTAEEIKDRVHQWANSSFD